VGKGDDDAVEKIGLKNWPLIQAFWKFFENGSEVGIANGLMKDSADRF